MAFLNSASVIFTLPKDATSLAWAKPLNPAIRIVVSAIVFFKN